MRRFLILLVGVCVFSIAQAADMPANLTLLADPSLALPLTAVARNYTREHGVPVTVVLVDGQDTAQQIGQGLDAHIIITANHTLLEALNAHGLVDVFSNKSVARTQLALVAPAEIARRSDLAKFISFSAILYAQPNLPVYLAPEESVEGERAQALLRQPDYTKLLESRVALLENRDAMVPLLATQPGFALMLAVDAANDPSLKVLTVLPDDVIAPVDYQAVLIAGEGIESSRTFVGYLQSASAQAVFAKYGFGAVDK